MALAICRSLKLHQLERYIFFFYKVSVSLGGNFIPSLIFNLSLSCILFMRHARISDIKEMLVVFRSSECSPEARNCSKRM